MNTLHKLLVRRRFIVDPRFQLSLVARGVGLCGLVLLVLALGLLWPLIRQPGDDAADAILAIDAATVLLYMHDRLWWIGLVCLLVALVVTISVSHRIAGPLVRIKRQLRTIGEGGLPAPLYTRRGDYLKDEVEILNRTVASLGEHIDALRAAQGVLAVALEAARERTTGSGDADTRRAIAEVITAAEVLRTRLAVFRHIPEAGVAPGGAPVPVSAAGLVSS